MCVSGCKDVLRSRFATFFFSLLFGLGLCNLDFRSWFWFCVRLGGFDFVLRSDQVIVYTLAVEYSTDNGHISEIYRIDIVSQAQCTTQNNLDLRKLIQDVGDWLQTNWVEKHGTTCRKRKVKKNPNRLMSSIC